MYMSTTQAAQELGVSVRQMRRKAALDRVPTRRYGNAWIFSSRQLQVMSRTSHRGRDWSEKTKVAALDFLARGSTNEFTGSERSRIKQRVRSASLGVLAGQILNNRVSLRRAATDQAKQRFAPSILSELGLSTGGGIGVVVATNAMLVARRAQLGLDDLGDVVVIEGEERHQRVLEALVLYAYGDTRENAAATDWIFGRQAAIAI